MGLGKVKNYLIKLSSLVFAMYHTQLLEEECYSGFFLIAVINTTTKSKLGEEKAYFILQPIVHHERMSGQERRQKPGGRN